MAIESFYLSEVSLAGIGGRNEGCGFKASSVDVKVSKTDSFRKYRFTATVGNVGCSDCKLAKGVSQTRVGGSVQVEGFNGPSVAEVSHTVRREISIAFPCEYTAQELEVAPNVEQ